MEKGISRDHVTAHKMQNDVVSRTKRPSDLETTRGDLVINATASETTKGGDACTGVRADSLEISWKSV